MKIIVPTFADGLSKKLLYPSEDRSGYVSRHNSSKMVHRSVSWLHQRGYENSECLLVKDVSSCLLGRIPIIFRFFLVHGKRRSERSYTCRLFLIDGKRRSERSCTCTRFHCLLPYYTESSVTVISVT